MKDQPIYIFIRIFFFCLLVSCCGISLHRQQATAESAFLKNGDSQKTALIHKINSLTGPQDAVALADESGKTLLAINENKLLIPASTLKLLTSLAAIHYLGEDFRFKTEFYLDPDQNLIIKGYGDPLLISEQIKKITYNLAKHISDYNDLVIDTSYFEEPLLIPGVTSSIQPYDSPNGALCVNFNTVCFQQDQGGRYISAEPQTPLLPYVLPKIKQSGLTKGRILLSSQNKECFQYAGYLFKYFLSENHISSSGQIKTGKADPLTDQLLYTHISAFPLLSMVERLLEYSNNYMANQLLIAMSAKVYSAPGTLEKGVKILSEFSQKALNTKHIRLAEGSGISRKNRITAKAMLSVLNKFYPYRHLLRKKDNIYYKTGHLNGIRTRAGYIETPDGKLLPFVIMINTPHKSDQPLLTYLNQYALK